MCVEFVCAPYWNSLLEITAASGLDSSPELIVCFGLQVQQESKKTIIIVQDSKQYDFY
jgi:hypothetical protein